jgi:tellurite methyltransferase
MQRAMVGFDRDDEGHYRALLDCGHRQHVRHDPPLVERPWVLTGEGRASRLGQTLDCVRCDRFEMPAHFVAYKETADFTEDSVPAALLRDHTTKPGVWARIIVLEGALRYHVDALGAHLDLRAGGAPGVVLPEVPHRVEPLAAVRFHVQFYRAPVAPAEE